MPFIGNQPAEAYSSFQKQDFSTSATTSYTLDHPVANQNEIALFINFVRQEPTTAYTASGTSLTLTSATTSSDDMYCVYLGKAVQTVNPPSGSVGSSQVAASIITGQTAETSIATDDTVLIHDTSAGALRKMTRANFVSGVGGDNTPAFYAELSASQTIGDAGDVKVQFNTEILDTDSAYDNSTNYRFTVPSGEGGKYFVFTGLTVYGSVAYSVFDTYLKVYKNGSVFLSEQHYEHDSTPNGSASFHIGRVMDLSAGDYLEVYNYCDVNGGNPVLQGGTGNSNNTYFGAYKLIGV
jgi:hypothetical protein